MTLSEKELWTKIENFQLDNPKVSFQFSTRLSRENCWSKEYTQRVIQEYKKFIFLCCISSSGVTPSDPVDQVWHLHLTYTKSYWIDFCKNTLEKEIHHNPTTGGQNESDKFKSNYSTTQLLYKQMFGYTPPNDIWQDNKTRFSDVNFQRINIRKYWVIRRPRLILNSIFPIILFFILFLFIQAEGDNSIFIFIAILLGLFALISIVKTIRGKGSGDSGCGTTGCSTSSCSSSSSKDNDTNTNSDSGCSDSGCSGCGSD